VAITDALQRGRFSNRIEFPRARRKSNGVGEHRFYFRLRKQNAPTAFAIGAR
jgi:hypothetical protein